MTNTTDARYTVLYDFVTDLYHVADNLTGDVSEEAFSDERDAQTLADEWIAAEF